MCGQCWHPHGQPLKGCEAVREKEKLQWRLQEIKGEQEHETSAKDRGSQPKTGALKAAVLKGQGCPSLISYHKSTCP